MKNVKILLGALLVVIGFSCREPFDPPVNSATTTYLVVEGVLNAGTGSTAIRLTRTYSLDAAATIKPVTGATVSVEGKDLTLRTLTMTGPGLYTSPNLNLIMNNEYRLKIKTPDGKEYASEYVVARKTPEIDSIGWKRDDKGVKINVNTHDLSDKTRYYKWDYEETWEIRSNYYSNYKYVGNGVVVDRPTSEQIYNCWRTGASTTILIGNSARLGSDVIAQAPLLAVSEGDEKIGIRYSILVRQYALDKPGYEFYDMMKKTTETIGTVFDPQPTEIKGNIKCVNNPGELIVGYITASTITEKRIFISNAQLPNWRFYLDCISYDVPNNKDSIKFYFDGGSWMPYDAVTSLTGAITAYSSSYPTCVDCTKRGGSTTKPSFW